MNRNEKNFFRSHVVLQNMKIHLKATKEDVEFPDLSKGKMVDNATHTQCIKGT